MVYLVTHSKIFDNSSGPLVGRFWSFLRSFLDFVTSNLHFISDNFSFCNELFFSLIVFFLEIFWSEFSSPLTPFGVSVFSSHYIHGRQIEFHHNTDMKFYLFPSTLHQTLSIEELIVFNLL